ncbi:MAG TPA: HAD family hydrolase [Pyrinomonadaceae bacterium]|nr:HAD family hydrolase [Pyrinomonadaceae bacterium]
MIKTVIFDVDGTLVDTVDTHAKAWQRALKEYGKEVQFSAVREQIGKGADQLMPVFLSREEVDRLGDEIEKRRGEIFKQDYLPKTKAFPQVRELVERIQRDGKRVVLASSANRDEVEHFKKVTNIGDLLEGETSADDAEKSKPEPDIFLAAMTEGGNPAPSEAIVVGDTPYDAIAAAKANIKTIGLLCGGFPEQSLKDAGCVAIYKDPADLLARYEESPIVKDVNGAAGQ